MHKVYVKTYEDAVVRFNKYHPEVKGDLLYVGVTASTMEQRNKLDLEWATESKWKSRAQAILNCKKMTVKILAEFSSREEAEAFESKMIACGVRRYGCHKEGGLMLNIKP